MPKFKVQQSIPMVSKSERVALMTRLNQSRSKVKEIVFASIAKSGSSFREKMDQANEVLGKRKAPVFWGNLDLLRLPKWARQLVKLNMRFQAPDADKGNPANKVSQKAKKKGINYWDAMGAKYRC